VLTALGAATLIKPPACWWCLTIIIICILALVLLGWGGYNFWAKKTGAPQLPSIPSLITSEGLLQGIWAVKEVYCSDPQTGELKLMSLEESGKKYI